MGSEGETESRKPHYDISMSRRTRKPQNLKQKSFEERENEELMMGRENQKSLKQLIQGRCSLEQHFREEEAEEKEKEKEEEEEEKQQSVVVRPPDLDGDGRLRLKKTMIKNYAQIMSRMIKVKQESYVRSWRKSAVLSIKLIKHK